MLRIGQSEARKNSTAEFGTNPQLPPRTGTSVFGASHSTRPRSRGMNGWSVGSLRELFVVGVDVRLVPEVSTGFVGPEVGPGGFPGGGDLVPILFPYARPFSEKPECKTAAK